MKRVIKAISSIASQSTLLKSDNIDNKFHVTER